MKHISPIIGRNSQKLENMESANQQVKEKFMNLKTCFYRKRISVTPDVKMHTPNLDEVEVLQEEVVNPNFDMVIKTYDKRDVKNPLPQNKTPVEEKQQDSIRRENSGASMNNHIKEVIDQYEIEQVQNQVRRKRARTANRQKKKSMCNNYTSSSFFDATFNSRLSRAKDGIFLNKRNSYERLFKLESPRNDILVVGLNIKK